MNNSLLILLIICMILIIILLLRRPSANIDSKELKKQNELLLKLVESKLGSQSNSIQTIANAQTDAMSRQINQIDLNLQKSTSNSELKLEKMIQQLELKQEKQSEQMASKNLSFEKQLVKLGVLDESLVNLQERIVDLSMILGNTKARGTFGEIQLYQLVDNYYGIGNSVVTKQDTLSNKTIVDLSVVNNIGQKLCIDSKFPLENYLEFLETGEVGFKNLFERDIKKHIDDIKKKYIIGGETLNFAIMFIPSESIYLEIMDNSKLVDYSYRNKVWIASPTTLLALVTMLENINTDYKRMENINKVESELEKLSIEFDRFTKRYNNLAKHLQSVINDFEDINITQNKLKNRFEAIKKMEMKGENDESTEATK